MNQLPSPFRAWCWSLLTAFLFVCQAEAYPRPVDGQRVYDNVGYMPNRERVRALEARILAFEASHNGTQIAVLTVDNTEGQTMEQYALGVLRTWGIGQAERNNGALLLVVRHAPGGREGMRIEVGYGLEGVLPDVICTRIVTEVVAPIHHRNNDAQGAIEAGVNAVMQRVSGGTGLPNTPSGEDIPIPVLIMMIILFFLTIGGAWWMIGGEEYWRRRQRRKSFHKMLDGIKKTVRKAVHTYTVTAEGIRPQLGRESDTEFFYLKLAEVRQLETIALEWIANGHAHVERDDYRARENIELSTRGAQDALNAICACGQELLERHEEFIKADERLAKLPDETAQQIADAEEELRSFTALGHRLSPEDLLKDARSQFNEAAAIAAETDISKRDPVQAAELYESAARSAYKATLIWRERVQNIGVVDKYLEQVPAKTRDLPARLEAATHSLEKLKRAHVASIWQPVSAALTTTHSFLMKLPRLLKDASAANTPIEQRYDQALTLHDEIVRGLEQAETSLLLPIQRHTEADAAHRGLPDKVHAATKLQSPAQAKTKERHVSNRTKAALQLFDEQLMAAMRDMLAPAPRDWISLSDQFDRLRATGEALLSTAEQEIAAGKRADDYASSDTSSSTTVYSSPTYDSGGGGGFGGGSGGGGGGGGEF